MNILELLGIIDFISEVGKMTDYEYDEYQEVMKQALLTMNELLNAFELQESEDKE